MTALVERVRALSALCKSLAAEAPAQAAQARTLEWVVSELETALTAAGQEGAAPSPCAEGNITTLGKCHVLIGEVRRCISDDNLMVAHRKLDALDREVAALFDGSQSNG